ncbi:hypothetical protein Esti_003748 [Eimeria stiedai]
MKAHLGGALQGALLSPVSGGWRGASKPQAGGLSSSSSATSEQDPTAAAAAGLSSSVGLTSSSCLHLRGTLSRIIKGAPGGRRGRAVREAAEAAEAALVKLQQQQQQQQRQQQQQQQQQAAATAEPGSEASIVPSSAAVGEEGAGPLGGPPMGGSSVGHLLVEALTRCLETDSAKLQLAALDAANELLLLGALRSAADKQPAATAAAAPTQKEQQQQQQQGASGGSPTAAAPGTPAAAGGGTVESLSESICALAGAADDSVMLQVVRCLLTASTAARPPLHGRPLLGALAALSSICVNATTEENVRAAHAALLQAAATLVLKAEAEATAAAAAATETAAAATAAAEQQRQSMHAAADKRESSGAVASEDEEEDADAAAARGTAAAAAPAAAAPAAAASAAAGGSDTAAVEADQSAATCAAPAAAEEAAAGAAQEQISNSGDGTSRQLGRLPKSRSSSRSSSSKSTSSPLLREMRDLLLTLQSLCRMAEGYGAPQGSPKEQQQGTPRAAAAAGSLDGTRTGRSKRLALEVILAVVRGLPHILWRHHALVLLLRRQLMPALGTAVAEPALLSVALEVVAAVCGAARGGSLRAEACCFVGSRVLPLLLSLELLPMQQQLSLLQFCMRCFSASPPVVLCIFAAFDLSVETQDVVALAVHTLQQAGPAAQQQQQQQEVRLAAVSALRALVLTVKSWSLEVRAAEAAKGGNSTVQKLVEETVSPEPSSSQQASPQLDSSQQHQQQQLAEQPRRRGGDGGSRRRTRLNAEEVKRRRQLKMQLRSAIDKFNEHPSEGVSALLELLQLPSTPQEAAQLLLLQQGLNKKAIGEFLGADSQEAREVLGHFASLLSFEGQPIDVALRQFLRLFRLPGEAQKIDRIIEKFAERFFLDNQRMQQQQQGEEEEQQEQQQEQGKEQQQGAGCVLESADCCYILAFSLIMLHTDLHSREVRPQHKMTKAEFVKNNRGINGGKDLPVAFLERLYDRVAAEEWVLEEDSWPPASSGPLRLRWEEGGPLSASPSSLGAGGLQAAFLAEAAAEAPRSSSPYARPAPKGVLTEGVIPLRSKKRGSPFGVSRQVRGFGWKPGGYADALLQRRGDSGISAFLSEDEMLDLLPFLLETIGAPLLHAFAGVVKDQGAPPAAADEALDGLGALLSLCCRQRQRGLRDAAAATLRTLCQLDQAGQVPLQQRQVKAVQLLLRAAAEEGDSLETAWRDVFVLVSQLELLQAAYADSLKAADTLGRDDRKPRSLKPSPSRAGAAAVATPAAAAATTPATPTAPAAAASRQCGAASSAATAAAPAASSAGASPLCSKEVPSPSGASLGLGPQDGRPPLPPVSLGTPPYGPLLASNLALVEGQVDLTYVDLIFTQSVHLSAEAICCFVSALQQVSLLELRETTDPRTCCLQKLVEVTDYNMQRSACVWSHIWTRVREHLAAACLHPCMHVRLYALDSLRQLASKFLEQRPRERALSPAQQDFLVPFLTVLTNAKSGDAVKDYTLDVLQFLVDCRGSALRSAWRVVLLSLHAAAADVVTRAAAATTSASAPAAAAPTPAAAAAAAAVAAAAAAGTASDRGARRSGEQQLLSKRLLLVFTIVEKALQSFLPNLLSEEGGPLVPTLTLIAANPLDHQLALRAVQTLETTAVALVALMQPQQQRLEKYSSQLQQQRGDDQPIALTEATAARAAAAAAAAATPSKVVSGEEDTSMARGRAADSGKASLATSAVAAAATASKAAETVKVEEAEALFLAILLALGQLACRRGGYACQTAVAAAAAAEGTPQDTAARRATFFAFPEAAPSAQQQGELVANSAAATAAAADGHLVEASGTRTVDRRQAALAALLRLLRQHGERLVTPVAARSAAAAAANHQQQLVPPFPERWQIVLKGALCPVFEDLFFDLHERRELTLSRSRQQQQQQQQEQQQQQRLRNVTAASCFASRRAPEASERGPSQEGEGRPSSPAAAAKRRETACATALHELVLLLKRHFNLLRPLLLPFLALILGGLEDPPTECGARLSVEALRQLLHFLRDRLLQEEAADIWTAITKALQDAFSKTMPQALLAGAAGTPQSLRLSFGLYFGVTSEETPRAAAPQQQQQQQEQQQHRPQQHQQQAQQQHHKQQQLQPVQQQQLQQRAPTSASPKPESMGPGPSNLVLQQQEQRQQQQPEQQGGSISLAWLLRENGDKDDGLVGLARPLPLADRRLLLRCLPKSTCSSSSSGGSGAVGAFSGLSPKLPFDDKEVAAKCVAQLLLIELVQKDLPRPAAVPLHALRLLVSCLESSFLFARLFNQQVALRARLQRSGFMSGLKQLPGLLKQHRDAAATAASLLLAAVEGEPQQQRHQPKDRCTSEETEHAAASAAGSAAAAPPGAASADAAAAAAAAAAQVKAFALDRYLRYCLWCASQYLTTEQQVQRLAEAVQEQQKQQHATAAVRAGGAAGVAAPVSDHARALQQLELAEGTRELTNLSFLLSSCVLKGLARLPVNTLESNASLVLGLLLELTAASSAEIRKQVRCTTETILACLLPHRFSPLQLLPPLDSADGDAATNTH